MQSSSDLIFHLNPSPTPTFYNFPFIKQELASPTPLSLQDQIDLDISKALQQIHYQELLYNQLQLQIQRQPQHYNNIPSPLLIKPTSVPSTSTIQSHFLTPQQPQHSHLLQPQQRTQPSQAAEISSGSGRKRAASSQQSKPISPTTGGQLSPPPNKRRKLQQRNNKNILRCSPTQHNPHNAEEHAEKDQDNNNDNNNTTTTNNQPKIKSESAGIVVVTGDKGEKLLSYPESFLEALYDEDWESVLDFLTQHRSTILSAASSSSCFADAPSSPPRPSSPSLPLVSGGLIEEGNASGSDSESEGKNNNNLKEAKKENEDESVPLDLSDKFAVVNSIPFEKRQTVLGNADIASSFSTQQLNNNNNPTASSTSSASSFLSFSCPFFPEVTLRGDDIEGEGEEGDWLLIPGDDGISILRDEDQEMMEREKQQRKAMMVSDCAGEKEEEENNCAIWKGPFRRAKGRCYPIVSFPKLKLNNVPVMKLLLCWKYPQEARACDLLGCSLRRVISTTCGNTCCINEKHCKIKGIFENGKFIFSSRGSSSSSSRN